MNELWSNRQVKQFVNKPMNFVYYDQLKNMRDWRDLFGRCKRVLLLYSDPNISVTMGHWVGLKIVGNRLIFFDSYGYNPDDGLKFITYPYQAELARILYNSPYDLHYNGIKLQSDDTAVCGRYVALFLKYCGYDVDKFVETLIKMANEIGITTDELVVKLTS